MTVVAYRLEKMHKSYKRLQYSRLVSCNCDACLHNPQPIFYSLDVLLKFLEDKQTQIQCQSSYRMVDVRRLMDDAADTVSNMQKQIVET